MAIQDLSRAAGTAKQLATIAKIVAGLKKVQAANTGGLGPSGNTGGGGSGGAAAAPVSTLAALPKSALLDTLVKNGLIKEGMPAEQALAIMKFAQLREGVPVNVSELMKLVSGDYAKTSGDILGAGQQWMEQLYNTANPATAGLDYRGGKYYDASGNVIGTGVTEDSPFTPLPGGDYRGGIYYDAQGVPIASAPTEDSTLSPIANGDTNAGMFAQDPIFSSYAGGMAQLDETADLNEATDLAWFRKEQEAQETYYNDMMNAISTGALPIGAAAAGGGGGGGGGGGRRGGGYGGGGGGGSGEAGDLRTRITTDEGVTETANERVLNTLPGFRPDMLGFASQFGPEVTDQIEEILNLTSSGRGQDVLAALEEKQQLMDAENTAYDAVQENNAMWSSTAPAEFRRLLDDYEAKTGLSLGDDPNTPGEQAFHYAERTGDDPRTLDVQEGPENKYSYGPADIALMQPAQQEEIAELQQLLEPALLGATGNNVTNPADMAKGINIVGYLQSLAKNRLASDTAGGIGALIGTGNNQTAADAVQAAAASIPTAAQPVTPDIMSKLQEVFGNISQQEAPQYNALSSANPGSLPVGGIPESGGSFPVRPQRDPDAPIGPSGIPASDPAIMGTSEWLQDPNAWNPLMPGPLAAVPGQDAIAEANAPQSEQAMQGIAALVRRAIESRPPSPGQLYNQAGVGAEQANDAFNSSTTRQGIINEGDPWGGNGPPPIMDQGPGMGQLGVPNVDVDTSVAGRLADIVAQTTGNPTQTTSSGEGFVPQNQAIMQGLARAGLLNRSQQDTPSDPTSDIARAIAQQAGAQRLGQAAQTGTQAPGELPDLSGLDPTAILKAQNDAMIPELERLGYSGEDLENYRYNWNGMNVSPETMREHYLQQAIMNQPSWGNPEGSGRLKNVVERLMQSRSLADLAADTSEFTEEGRRNYGQEGEYYKDDAGITAEQRELNQKFADLIPTFQDYINTGGNQPGGFSYNPNADDTIIYSNFNTAMRNAVKNSTSQTAYTDPNTEDPSGFYPPTGDMPYGDFELTPPEENIDYESTLSLGSGGSKPAAVNFPGKARELQGIAQIMKKSAESLKLPPTVQRTLPTTKTSGGSRRGTGAAGGGANRAAQGASALARLAKVLKGFK